MGNYNFRILQVFPCLLALSACKVSYSIKDLAPEQLADHSFSTGATSLSGIVNTPLPNDLVAEVKTARGYGVPNVVIDWQVSSGAAVLAQASSSTDKDGKATNQVTLGKVAGPIQVLAVVRGVDKPITINILAIHGPAAQVVFTKQPSEGTAGMSFAQQPIVQIQDAFGNSIDSGPDSTASVALSLALGSGTLSGTKSIQAIAGLATFSGLSLDLIGSKSLSASVTTSAGSFTKSTSSFMVSAGPAAQLTFNRQPGGGAAGVAWAQQPIIQIQDAFGNLVTSGTDSTISVTMALSTGTGTLTTMGSVAAVAGQATFSGLSMDLVGNDKVITATAALSSGSKSVASSAFTITPGAGSQILFANQPGGGMAGVAWLKQPILLIRDSFGNLVNTGVDSTAQVRLSLSTGTGTLSGSATVVAAAGQAAFTGLSLDLVGTNKVLTASVTLSGVQKTQTSDAFAIAPNNPTKIAIVSGNNQSGSINANLANPLIVSITDNFTNIVPNVAVDWAVASGDATLGSATVMSNATGQASNTLKLGVNGTDTIQATLRASGAMVSFQANTIPAVNGTSTPLASGTYGVGQAVAVSVSFTKPVVVTGSPRIQLNLGTSKFANYVSGSGTSTLNFNYMVVSGDASSDLDYSSTAALTLNGGTIKDSVGNNAVLTLAAPQMIGSLSVGKTIIINTTPTTRSVNLAWDKVSYTVAGYKLYYGPVSGEYTVTVDVAMTSTPNTPVYTVTGLDPNSHYFFVVTAYTAVDESGYSNEVGI